MSKPYDPIRDCSPSVAGQQAKLATPQPPAIHRTGSNSLLDLLDGPPPPAAATSSGSDSSEGLESPDLDSPVPLTPAATGSGAAGSGTAPAGRPATVAPPPPVQQAPAVNPYISPASHSSSLPPRPSSSSSSSRHSQPPASTSAGSSSRPTTATASGSRPRTAYAPNRVTPPYSILRALSADEYEAAMRDPARGSRNALRGWKRGDDAARASAGSSALGEGGGAGGPGKRALEEGTDSRPTEGEKRQRVDELPKPVEDVKAIASHYNHRPEYGKDNRRFSPIFGLKSFNNWIKSVLIGKFAPLAITGQMGDGMTIAPSGRGVRRPEPKGSVLDLGCGKGGDLNKWNAARVARYTGLDIADVSITQAVARAEDMRNICFDFEFHAVDCFSEPLSSVLPPARLDQRPFDMVTMQFCMHYAFETEAKARQMLENVARGLKPGGVFIGTTPNAEKLIEQVLALPEDVERLAFGNDVYSIEFSDRSEFRPYGHRYEFYLQDAVEDVPEYLVDWPNFTSLAEEYGLYVVYKKEFHEVFAEEKDRPEFKELLTRMKVVNAAGESEMNQDQWEAANLYLAFALERR